MCRNHRKVNIGQHADFYDIFGNHIQQNRNIKLLFCADLIELIRGLNTRFRTLSTSLSNKLGAVFTGTLAKGLKQYKPDEVGERTFYRTHEARGFNLMGRFGT